MNTKLKNLLKGIFEIGLLIIVLVIISRIMVLKSEDGYDQMQSFYKQKSNTVDALFLGSSKVYCQIDTGILWDDYGISGFNLGGAEATTWNSYYYLKEVVKTQKPKVIFYDVGILANEPDVEFQKDKWAITNNYGMKWNKNRIDQLLENTEDFDSFRELVFPLGTMHSRYLELTENDFDDKNNNITYKGFDYRSATTSLEEQDVSHVIGQTPLTEKQEEYIVKMFDLAKEANIPFVVIVAPYMVSEEDQRIFNYINELCDNNEIIFIDFNELYDELGIDFATDFAEELHMNFSGTEKYSSYLGKYITDNYDVTDHRGDKKYASWEADALINRQNRLAYDINNTYDADEINSVIMNDNYVVFKVGEMTELSIYDDGKEIVYADGDKEYKSNITDGDLRIIVHRVGETSTININGEEIEIGFPWRRVIAYDKVLKKIVYDHCSYEE